MTKQASKFDIIDLYLDYVNNFVSTQGFARWYNLSEKQARAIISLGRELHEDHLAMVDYT